MLNHLVSNAPLFLLIAVRCFATVLLLPMFSSRTVPRIAKLAISIYIAYFIFSNSILSNNLTIAYSKFISPEGNFSLEYILLLVGEVLIGIILGFFVQIIFSAFSTAGQFFSFQMGFSASEVYDALNQVENPLMGQFFNFVAILVFISSHWFQTIFLSGLLSSFENLNAFSIINNNSNFAKFMMLSLSRLFKSALFIALPIMATLFLINVTMGLLSKAAPQMNLLSEGFPILILVTFVMILYLLPSLINLFQSSFRDCFKIFHSFIKNLS